MYFVTDMCRKKVKKTYLSVTKPVIGI